MTVDVDDTFTVEVGAVAHGGHCVARLPTGQVAFVRHTLPGERVRLVVTERAKAYVRADAVEVFEPAPGRVPPPCHHARPGGCGGCDWQHVDPATQRALKAAVVEEQLRRLGGVTRAVEVEELPGGALGWRTRERFAVDEATGRLGLRKHRSHDVEVLEACPIAHPLVGASGVLAQEWPRASEVSVAVAPSSGDSAVIVDGAVRGPVRLRERVGAREWRVSAAGFWQVHPAAAEAFVAAVREALQPGAGEHLVDLYSGSGLFAGALADDLGPGGRVDAVEESPTAIRDARRSLHDLPTVVLHEARVAPWLRSDAVRRCDLVVLDPPRSGAGADVVRATVARSPRRIAYVACDPAALARDVATYASLGWSLTGLRAFDAFPMTHHVECVATLQPA